MSCSHLNELWRGAHRGVGNNRGPPGGHDEISSRRVDVGKPAIGCQCHLYLVRF